MKPHKINSMKLKIVLVGILLPLFNIVYSQQKSDYERQLRKYTAKIDSIVGIEKENMNKEFEILEKKFSNNEISESDLNSKKTEIAQTTEKNINDKIALYKDEFEEITQTTVNNAVFNKSPKKSFSLRPGITLIDFDYQDFEDKDADNPKSYYQKLAYIMSLSLLNHTDNSNIFDFSKSRELKNGSSASLMFRYENKLGKTTSPFFYRIGLGWRFDQVSPKNDMIFAQDNNTLFIQNFEIGNLKNAYLRKDYLYIPVELQWVANPKYKEYKGEKYIDNTQQQFRIGVGVYGGYMINKKNHIYFDNQNGQRIHSRETVENGLNKFLFGGKFSLSYGGLNLYVMKDFTTIFNKNAMLKNKNGIQIGVDVFGIIF